MNRAFDPHYAPTPPSESWEERFDDKYIHGYGELYSDIKSFIQKEIEVAKQEPRYMGSDAWREHFRAEGKSLCLKKAEKLELHAPADEYVAKVKKWNKTYDRAFDDGFAQAKAQIISTLSEIETQKSSD